MSDELARAARELLAAASDPIRYPSSSEYAEEVAFVPANLLYFLKEALEPSQPPLLNPASDWFRGDGGETIEVRYLDIPGRELAANGLREIDEVVCGPVHLETLDANHAYIRVAGLMVNIWATCMKSQRSPRLSITCEPDDCTRQQAAEVRRA